MIISQPSFESTLVEALLISATLLSTGCQQSQYSKMKGLYIKILLNSEEFKNTLFNSNQVKKSCIILSRNLFRNACWLDDTHDIPAMTQALLSIFRNHSLLLDGLIALNDILAHQQISEMLIQLNMIPSVWESLWSLLKHQDKQILFKTIENLTNLLTISKKYGYDVSILHLDRESCLQ